MDDFRPPPAPPSSSCRCPFLVPRCSAFGLVGRLPSPRLVPLVCPKEPAVVPRVCPNASTSGRGTPFLLLVWKASFAREVKRKGTWINFCWTCRGAGGRMSMGTWRGRRRRGEICEVFRANHQRKKGAPNTASRSTQQRCVAAWREGKRQKGTQRNATGKRRPTWENKTAGIRGGSPANSPPRSPPTQMSGSAFPLSCRHHPLKTTAYPPSANSLESGPHQNGAWSHSQAIVVRCGWRKYLAGQAHGRVI